MKAIGHRVGLLLCAFALALAVGGCGGGTTSSSGTHPTGTIGMGATSFDQTAATVQANTPIHFADTTDGGNVHILCVAAGTAYSTTCLTSGNAPPELLRSPGLTFNPGDTKDLIFTTPGTYNMVCTVHPGMHIIITVQ